MRIDKKSIRINFGTEKGIPLKADNRFQRWASYLSGFRYKIEPVSSEANANCDALSRLPMNGSTESVETNFSQVFV